MSTQDLHSSQMLKKALFSLPQGMPVSTSHLKEFGISRQLAYRYVQYGWLTQLGYGYYLRPGDKLTETGTVASLQDNGVKIHIGGKNALSLKGFTHYLSMGGETLTLYGHGVRSLPKWFQEQFKTSLSNSLLFDESENLADKCCVSHLDQSQNAPFVAEPERAVLEMLDLLPKQQTFDEARQIIKGLQSLRSKKLQELLTRCKKIKVKRLFWQIAEELQLPVLKKIDLSKVHFGAKSVYILQGEKNLVLRNPSG